MSNKPTPPIQAMPDGPPLLWKCLPEAVLDTGGAIRLVRLSDLVCWLMRAKDKSFQSAVLALHKELTARKEVALYVVTSTGAARAVGPLDTFDLNGQGHGRCFFSRGIDDDRSTVSITSRALPEGVTPGVSAALLYVEKVWGNGLNLESTMDYPNSASLLAITGDDAAAIWGTDDQADDDLTNTPAFEPSDKFIALRKQRTANPGEEWTPFQRNVLSDERDRLNAMHKSKKGVTKFLADSLGLNSDEAVNKQIRLFKVAEKAAKDEKERNEKTRVIHRIS